MMGYSLSDKLVAAVSSRALFDLEAKNKIFEEIGLDGYYEYQLQKENTPLFSASEKQVEVIILSKNNAATSLRITNAIK